MTNLQIIEDAKIQLAQEGKINVNELGIPEEIGTYNYWKTFGFKVKKGERSICKIQIWKYKEETKFDEKTKKEYTETKIFLKSANFFKKSQVELI